MRSFVPRRAPRAEGKARELAEALDAGFDKYANQGVPQLFDAVEKWDLPRFKELIAASGATVADGEQHVQAASRTMQEIVEAIGRVAGIVDRIAAASDEQSTGIGQVNEAVMQIDRFTQQNAALDEQAAAAAGSVSEQAQRLRDSVAVFRLG